MIDAIMFMLGAVLFPLAVLFFIFVWSDRNKFLRQRDLLTHDQKTLKVQKADLEIWDRELQVWYDSLEHQQHQLEQEREEIRMLTASKHPPIPLLSGDSAPTKVRSRRTTRIKGKNAKETGKVG